MKDVGRSSALKTFFLFRETIWNHKDFDLDHRKSKSFTKNLIRSFNRHWWWIAVIKVSSAEIRSWFKVTENKLECTVFSKEYHNHSFLHRSKIYSVKKVPGIGQ